MASTLAVGVTSSIDATRASPALFSARECQAVLDYGGCSTVHRKVLRKKRRNARGHARQADDAPAPAVSSSIRVQRSAKVSKKRRVSSLNRCVPRRHRRAVSTREAAPVEVTFHRCRPSVDRRCPMVLDRSMRVRAVPLIQVQDPRADHRQLCFQVREQLVAQRELRTVSDRER